MDTGFTRYSFNTNDKCFNNQPKNPLPKDITEADRQRAQDKLEDLIQQTRENLSPFTQAETNESN